MLSFYQFIDTKEGKEWWSQFSPLIQPGSQNYVRAKELLSTLVKSCKKFSEVPDVDDLGIDWGC